MFSDKLPTRGLASISLKTGNLSLRCFAAAVLVWASQVIPLFWVSKNLHAYAARIEGGEQFHPSTLSSLRSTAVEANKSILNNAGVLRDVALVDVRLAELALESPDRLARNLQLAAAEATVRRALQSNPSDGFLWYALFWLDRISRGFRQDEIGYLALSYKTSAHEGWVAVHRNRDALTIYDQLPDALRAKVLVEFRDLVAANFFDDTASILAGPGWSHHQLLLNTLADLPEQSKREFASRLAWRGLSVVVPGLPQKPVHPFEFAPG